MQGPLDNVLVQGEKLQKKYMMVYIHMSKKYLFGLKDDFKICCLTTCIKHNLFSILKKSF